MSTDRIAQHAAAHAALVEAVKTRLAHWDAMSVLETALGMPGGEVPDGVDDKIYNAIADLAAACDDTSWISPAELDVFLEAIGVTL